MAKKHRQEAAVDAKEKANAARKRPASSHEPSVLKRPCTAVVPSIPSYQFLGHAMNNLFQNVGQSMPRECGEFGFGTRHQFQQPATRARDQQSMRPNFSVPVECAEEEAPERACSPNEKPGADSLAEFEEKTSKSAVETADAETKAAVDAK